MKSIFQQSDYENGDGMLTKIWGPALWHSLHVLSFNYPVKPTKLQKKQYRNFILNLQYVLPCRHCRENLQKSFKKDLPLKISSMENRYTFSLYIYNLHEHVNKILNKCSGLSYSDVRDRYEHFRSRCHKTKSCNQPLVGKKSKCVLRIIPEHVKTKTLKINKECECQKQKKRFLHPKSRKVT